MVIVANIEKDLVSRPLKLLPHSFEFSSGK